MLIFHLKIKSSPPQSDRWADLLQAKLRIWFNNECLGRGGGDRWKGLTSKYYICCSDRELGMWKIAAPAAVSTATFIHPFGYFVQCEYMVECHHNKALYTTQINKTCEIKDGWTKIHSLSSYRKQQALIIEMATNFIQAEFKNKINVLQTSSFSLTMIASTLIEQYRN